MTAYAIRVLMSIDGSDYVEAGAYCRDALGALVSAGLIERTGDPENPRADDELVITADGERVLALLAEHAAELIGG